MDALEELKLLTRETDDDAAACPDCGAAAGGRMFTDAQLMAFLNRENGNVRAAAYQVLLQKSQSTAVTIAGMTLPDQQKYFLRLAASVRVNGSRTAERADEP